MVEAKRNNMMVGRCNALQVGLFQPSEKILVERFAIILRSLAAGAQAPGAEGEPRVYPYIFQTAIAERASRLCLTALRPLPQGPGPPCPSLLAHAFLFLGVRDVVSAATGRRNKNENMPPRCNR